MMKRMPGNIKLNAGKLAAIKTALVLLLLFSAPFGSIHAGSYGQELAIKEIGPRAIAHGYAHLDFLSAGVAGGHNVVFLGALSLDST